MALFENTLEPLYWVGSAKKDMQKMPKTLQQMFGKALLQVQLGEIPEDTKVLKGFKQVIEIRRRFNKGAYRVIYTTIIKDRVYVLHAFQKKSKKGISTPKEEVEIIRTRYKRVKDAYEK